jgi:prevent-host-death family protein
VYGLSPNRAAHSAKSANIHEAKTNLSKLVAKAAKGERFMIAKAGKPLVKVVPLDLSSPGEMRRLGFLAKQISVPDNFDRMGEEEIAQGFVKTT